jgi:hypothetical protein
MPDGTVTLRLAGEMTVTAFSKAVEGFGRLLDALAAEETDVTVRWVLAGLDYGSALLTATPARDDEAMTDAIVDKLSRRYIEVARDALQGPAAGVDTTSSSQAARIVALTRQEHVPEVSFETADDEVTFTADDLPDAVRAERIVPAVGTVRGRVQTLRHRGSLGFTLTDLNNDGAVWWYLDGGQG